MTQVHNLQSAVDQDAVTRGLRVAVAKDVQYENGVYRFFDPGFSFVALRDLPIVQEKKFVYSHSWYEQYDWAKREDVPQERTLRIPVDGSFNETYTVQQKLLTADEEVASVRSVAMFLVINALSTGVRLLRDHFVRCIDKSLSGYPVSVGNFDCDGLYVAREWDDERKSDIALAATRKS